MDLEGPSSGYERDVPLSSGHGLGAKTKERHGCHTHSTQNTSHYLFEANDYIGEASLFCHFWVKRRRSVQPSQRADKPTCCFVLFRWVQVVRNPKMHF